MNVILLLMIMSASLLLNPGSAVHASDQFHLPTRAQTPILQGYFIPAYPRTDKKALSLTHSLYITNTYQIDTSNSEALLIDVENTRYDLQINIPMGLWYININAPLISNRAGFLDQTIENWHNWFGLPQGGRDNASNDKVELRYQLEGTDLFHITEASEGIGDIQLAAGYPLNQYSWIWFAVEIPAGTESELISNQSLDTAFWYHYQSDPTQKHRHSSLLGFSLLADDGLFANNLNSIVVFAQYAFNWRFDRNAELLIQADYHSPIVDDSSLDGLVHSLQAQFGLRFPRLIRQHTLELFFSEDIFPGHAPDITFGINLGRHFH